MASTNTQIITRLFRLPGELRNQIYELVLTHANDIVVDCDGHKAMISSPCLENPLAIVQTCRQTRSEGSGFFYSKNRCIVQTNAFVTNGPDSRFDGVERWAEHFWQWIRSVGLPNIKTVKHIVIDCGEWKARPGSTFTRLPAGLAHKAKIYNLLSDIVHFFRMHHPGLTIDFRAGVTYHYDLYYNVNNRETVVREDWRTYVNLTSFTLPMKTEALARAEMSRIAREEFTHLKQGLTEGRYNNQTAGNLHFLLSRFRASLGQLLDMCYKNPNPGRIDPFGDEEVIFSEARTSSDRDTAGSLSKEIRRKRMIRF